jgi:hypothetical protein
VAGAEEGPLAVGRWPLATTIAPWHRNFVFPVTRAQWLMANG